MIPVSFYDFIDIYCERVGQGFWAEPINALSNGAFIVAGLWFFLPLRKEDRPRDPFGFAMAALIVMIGTGSFLFHTFANFGSMLADVLPIFFYILLALYTALRSYFGLSFWPCFALLGVYIAGASIVPQEALNGSVGYVPALLATVLMGALLTLRGHGAGVPLLIAGGVFFVSLGFRSADNMLCTALPLGTHWLWHLLNAVVLFLITRTYIRYGSSGSTG